MWNFKHLIISIIFAVCAIACAVSFIFFDGANLEGSGFMGTAGASSNFAPMGAVIFAFVSIMFFKNARR